MKSIVGFRKCRYKVRNGGGRGGWLTEYLLVHIARSRYVMTVVREKDGRGGEGGDGSLFSLMTAVIEPNHQRAYSIIINIIIIIGGGNG